MLSLDIIDKVLKRSFSWTGAFIGTHPGYFIIVPLLLTALGATGFQRLVFNADPEYLFSPENGESHYERKVLEEFFPTNYSDFEPSRASRIGRFGKLIISAKDGGNILRPPIWFEALSLHNLLSSFSIQNNNLTYESNLCATYLDSCWKNSILSLAKHMPEIENGTLPLTYPLWFDPDTFERVTLNFFLGGVELEEDSTVKNAKVFALFYFLKSGTKEDIERGTDWEASFLATVASQNYSHISVTRFSSLTLEVELERNTNSVLPYFALNICLMISFCIITCMMVDWVKSKPLLGLFGVISAILATVTAFGTVIYIGVPFIGINLAAPFLMLGIGIDDTFVMLGSWRRSSPHSSVSSRLSSTYNEAAVSITITSLTDCLSFFIGALSPFPSVRIFCIYCGACILVTYIWHVTFFGGIMALAGYSEEKNRHSITCQVVLPRSKSASRNWFYRSFCAGGINPDDPYNPKDNSENALMIIFREQVAGALNNPYVKVFVLICFAIYLGISGWGISRLSEGLERKKLARYDSYSVEFYDMEDTYFREYPYRINLVISGALNYSDPAIQDKVENLLSNLENTTFIDRLYTESWYRDFLDYVRRNRDYVDLDISSEEKFISTLNDVYLNSGATHYNKDLIFNHNKSSILASRFLLQGSKIYNTNDEKIFVSELRAVCSESGLNATVFHPYFIYFDQFLLVLPTTVQCVLLAGVLMSVISFLFIHSSACLWVSFSIISIELGVIGLSSLWGISLDSISMINLIMCIGFSVDFSAHISYAYSCSPGTPKDKLRDCLYALGLPILQGATSTILGVIGLALAPSYVFLTFFKMVFLVILLGALHGLFLLPVLLSLVGGSKKEKNEEKEVIKIPRPKRLEIYSNSGYESEDRK